MCMLTAMAGISTALGEGLTTALSVGQAVVSMTAQAQQAQQQNDYYNANAQAANNAAMDKYAQELRRQREEMANNSRERQSAWRQGMEAQGTALASSQNEGNSTNVSLLDLARKAGNEIAIKNSELAQSKASGKENLHAIQNEAQSRINSVSTNNGISPLSVAVSGLGAFMDGQSKGRQYSKAMGKSGV